MRSLAGLAFVLTGLCAGCSQNSYNPEASPTPVLPPTVAVRDLRAVRVTPSRVSLCWTSPVTTTSEGHPLLYDVRYAAFPLTDSSWDQASTYYDPWFYETDVGETDSCSVTRLRADTRYYFGLKAKANGEDWSGISNTINLATSPSGPIHWLATVASDLTTPGPVLASCNSCIYISGIQADGAAPLIALDVSDPAHPVPLDWPLSAERVYMVSTANDRLYAIAMNSHSSYPYLRGMPSTLSIRLAFPRAPDVIGSYVFDDSLRAPLSPGTRQNWLLDFVAADDRLYVARDSTIDIINVSADAGPFLAGTFAMPAGLAAERVLRSGTTLLTLGTDDSRIGVFDLTDPDRPAPATVYQAGSVVNYVKVLATTLCACLQNHDIQVIDISIAAAPVVRNVIHLPWYAVDAAMQGSYLYVTGYDGVYAIHLTAPSGQAIVGSCDVPNAPSRVFADEDNLYVYDWDGGRLDILRSDLR
jgi:hypothetical protein